MQSRNAHGAEFVVVDGYSNRNLDMQSIMTVTHLFMSSPI